MKKIFLIVAVLMLATPALAVEVDVWAEQGDDVNEVEIWYEVYNPVPADCNDGNRPRAFGLNITVTDGNIIDINVPFEGECDDVNRGYGIFPGTISIVDGEVTGWGGPIAPDDAPGAEDTGLDTNTIVVEMGSLYTGANCPDPCAMLFFIIVNMDCNVTIAGNAARTGTGSPAKGVILENLAETEVHFPAVPFEVRNVSRWVPNVVGEPLADANDAIVAEDLVVGDITWVCDLTMDAGSVISTLPEGGIEVVQHSEVHLWVSLGDCDFGDADDPPYPTLLASDGARHIATGVILGVNRDTEADGQPSPNADLDDNTGAPDDEDGVTLLVVTPVGGGVTVEVTQACYLNAWMDFNDNGDWDDLGEQIFTDELLAVGFNPLTFAVPAYAVRETPLVSRWRVNDAGGLAYTGLADDGEIEDHLAEVVCHVPDVVNEPNLAAQDEIIANGFTVNVIAECNDVIPDGNVIRTDPPYCTTTICGSAVDIVVSTGPCEEEECYAGQPYYDDWVAFGSPECWCYPRQCHGDADGLAQGTLKLGFKYVDTWDLDIMSAGWQVKEPPKGPGIAGLSAHGVPAICADFDHLAQGTLKLGFKRVDTWDLDLMSAYWQVKEPPKGTGTPADCLPGNREPAP